MKRVHEITADGPSEALGPVNAFDATDRSVFLFISCDNWAGLTVQVQGSIDGTRWAPLTNENYPTGTTDCNTVAPLGWHGWIRVVVSGYNGNTVRASIGEH